VPAGPCCIFNDLWLVVRSFGAQKIVTGPLIAAPFSRAMRMLASGVFMMAPLFLLLENGKGLPNPEGRKAFLLPF
jgi:hypothetical protein